MTNDTIPKAEPVYNEIAEGLREMHWVFGELKRIACDEPDRSEKYRLADLVLSFKGAKKALPLNMTNWDSVAEITGEGDTARWPGHALELYPTTTTMQGKTVPCIRIRAHAQRELPKA